MKSSVMQNVVHWRAALGKTGDRIFRHPVIQGLRPAVDVSVHMPDGEIRVLEMPRGKPVPKKHGAAGHHAIVLPEACYLWRSVDLPWATASDTKRMLDLQMRSHTPFPEEQTRWGWTILPPTQADSCRRQALIVIASSADVTDHLRNQPLQETEKQPEIWALVRDVPIVFQGHGEAPRLHRQRKHWQVTLSSLGMSMLLIVALLLSPALAKRTQFQEIRAQESAWRDAAAPVMREREQLENHLQQLEGLYRIQNESVQAEWIIETLTSLVPDDAWLERLEVRGDHITITGFAGNAAALQQSLQQNEHLVRVRAAGPFSRDSATQKDRFTLEMEYRP